jgi:hypothetical protein
MTLSHYKSKGISSEVFMMVSAVRPAALFREFEHALPDFDYLVTGQIGRYADNVIR